MTRSEPPADVAEFLPCPFCGEDKRLSVAPGNAQVQTSVICGRCSTLGPTAWGTEDNAAAAIATWNRRTQRSEPPAEVIEAPEFGGRLGLTARRLALYADECALALKQAGYLGKGQSLEAKAADVIESLRASSSLGGIEGEVQREDALTAGALTAEKDAIGKRFRKLPGEIEAVQWTPLVEHPGVLIDEGKRLTDFYSPAPGSAMRDLPAYFVTTIHEQRAYLVPGDWILPEPKPGRYYPVKPDIFAATYEPAENVQAPVAGIRSALPPSSAREKRMEEALKPFAAVELSTLYAASDNEGYAVFIADDCDTPDFHRSDILRARAALSSDGRGREKGNTSNSDDGIDPTPPATNRSA